MPQYQWTWDWCPFNVNPSNTMSISHHHPTPSILAPVWSNLFFSSSLAVFDPKKHHPLCVNTPDELVHGEITILIQVMDQSIEPIGLAGWWVKPSSESPRFQEVWGPHFQEAAMTVSCRENYSNVPKTNCTLQVLWKIDASKIEVFFLKHIVAIVHFHGWWNIAYIMAQRTTRPAL